MRLILIRDYRGKEWINADLVTGITLYSTLADETLWEVTINFGEYWIEKRFREERDAMGLIHKIAGEVSS